MGGTKAKVKAFRLKLRTIRKIEECHKLLPGRTLDQIIFKGMSRLHAELQVQKYADGK